MLTWTFWIFAVIFSLLFVSFAKSPTDPFYTMRGIALDYLTGNVISLGNVTVVVKETGDRNASLIKNGIWIVNVSTNADYNSNKFTLGISLNNSDGKIGYEEITLGSGSFVSQATSCLYRPWTFSGYVVNLANGLAENSGAISVSINDIPFSNVTSNSTSISNGYFSLYFYPCLISGKAYTFIFTTFSGGTTSKMFTKMIAK